MDSTAASCFSGRTYIVVSHIRYTGLMFPYVKAPNEAIKAQTHAVPFSENLSGDLAPNSYAGC